MLPSTMPLMVSTKTSPLDRLPPVGGRWRSQKGEQGGTAQAVTERVRSPADAACCCEPSQSPAVTALPRGELCCGAAKLAVSTKTSPLGRGGTAQAVTERVCSPQLIYQIDILVCPHYRQNGRGIDISVRVPGRAFFALLIYQLFFRFFLCPAVPALYTGCRRRVQKTKSLQIYCNFCCFSLMHPSFLCKTLKYTSCTVFRLKFIHFSNDVKFAAKSRAIFVRFCRP